MIPYVIVAFLLGVLLTTVFFSVFPKHAHSINPTISVRPPFKVSTVNTSSTGEDSQDRSVIYLDDQHDMDIEKLRADEAM